MSDRFSSVDTFKEILDGGSVLGRGASGDAVRVLQEALRDMGFPMSILKNNVSQSGVDGAFGGQTETALRNFQVHAAKQFPDVSVTGFLDVPTMRALNALAPAKGSKAWDPGQPNHAPQPLWKAEPPKRLRIVVVKDEHRTFLYDTDGKCVGIFPNAHGTEGSTTDPGLKRIRTKLDEAAAKAAGKGKWGTERAFGVRILDLSWATGKTHGEELHGTYDYANMGKAVSHGCVRHYNEDIVSIYNQVKVGEYVAIVDRVDDSSLTSANNPTDAA
jgi:lipoprotein-anchoring transpeptidase ErfK/SrfK